MTRFVISVLSCFVLSSPAFAILQECSKLNAPPPLCGSVLLPGKECLGTDKPKCSGTLEVLGQCNVQGYSGIKTKFRFQCSIDQNCPENQAKPLVHLPEVEPAIQPVNQSCSISENWIPAMLQKQGIPFDKKAPAQENYKKLLKAVGMAETSDLLGMLDEILAYEKQNCADSAVFYFGSGFAGTFLGELRSLLPRREAGIATEYFKKTLALPGVDRLHADRDSRIRSQLQAVSLSIVSMGRNESAVDIFETARNINVGSLDLGPIVDGLMADLPAEKREKVKALVGKYKPRISRSITQVFIKKDALGELAYFSRPFGVPIEGLKQDEVLESLVGGPESFKEYVERKGNESVKRKMNVYESSYGAKLDSPKYFHVIQSRIFVGSSAYSDPNKVQQIFHYAQDERKAASELRQELKAIIGD